MVCVVIRQNAMSKKTLVLVLLVAVVLLYVVRR